MELSERKRKILEILVDNYIKSSTPISSKYIVENHLPQVSSATIRNELNALESMGYLYQPYTSAGRIPSAKAYETYVNSLMVKRGLAYAEIDYIERYLLNQITNVESVVKTASRVITEMTNYTTVALSSQHRDEHIQAIKLIKVNEHNLVLVLVTQKNNIKDSLVTCKEAINEEHLNYATSMLNKMFAGKTFTEALQIEQNLANVFEQFNIVLRQVLVLLKSCLNEQDNLYVSGSSKIFDYPEYKDYDNAKKLISIIDNKSVLIDLLKNNNTDFHISVNIGSGDSKLPDGCSVVSANYILNGSNIGSVGVLGPMRMTYDKVVSVLETIGNTIESILKD